MKTINLEEILIKNIGEADYAKLQLDLILNPCDIIEAMKEACAQTLELATENAKLIDIKAMNCDDHTPYRGACQTCGHYHNFEIVIGQVLDKQSILDTINQITKNNNN